jgi:hypothetical protein
MKHNPVAPSTTLVIGKDTFELLFSFNAVATVEDLIDRPLLTGLRSKDINSPTISLVRAMLYAALLPNHANTTYAEASALVTRTSLSEVWGKVLNAWSVGMAESDTEADDADPTKDQS